MLVWKRWHRVSGENRSSGRLCNANTFCHRHKLVHATSQEASDGAFTTVEDLVFDDDITFHRHIQGKIETSHYAGSVRINTQENRGHDAECRQSNPVVVDNILPCTNQLTYIWNTLTKIVDQRLILNQKLHSDPVSTPSNWSCILSVLLYGFECWRMTESSLHKLSTFHTICLSMILMIFWINPI